MLPNFQLKSIKYSRTCARRGAFHLAEGGYLLGILQKQRILFAPTSLSVEIYDSKVKDAHGDFYLVLQFLDNCFFWVLHKPESGVELLGFERKFLPALVLSCINWRLLNCKVLIKRATNAPYSDVNLGNCPHAQGYLTLP